MNNIIHCAVPDNIRRVRMQIWRIMRLSFIFIFAALMQVSAFTKAQKVTLNENNVSVESVLQKIRKQTGYDIIYNKDWLDQTKRISVNLNQSPIDEALKIVLADQPISFELTEQTIVLRKKETTFLERLADRWAAIDVLGKVVDEKGQPLAGATVKVKGKSQTTKTNKDGEFFLKDVDEGSILQISYVGYTDLEIKADKNVGSVQMNISTGDLQEVEINKGYYIEKQRFSVSNVGRVTAKEIENQPVSNPLLALQGKVPGLFITQSTGLPGSGVKVRIQGQNSLSRGSDPLYVIDGVPYPSQLLPSLSTVQGSSGNSVPLPIGAGSQADIGGNPLSFINPSDIESIAVLKDADATAIYGSQAANGAILITTKKGQVGKTKVEASLQSGLGKITNRLRLLNTTQYLEMRKEAIANDGLQIESTDYDINGFWDTSRQTDWQKELIGGTANYNDVRVSISGGTTNTQFLLGGGYHKETTVFPGDLNDQKGSFHFSVNNTSLNQKFKTNFTGGYLIDNNKLQSLDLTRDAMWLAPNAPTVYNSDKTINWMPDNGSSTWGNPIAKQYQKYNVKTSNLFSSLNMVYNIGKGLSITNRFGYNKLDIDEYNGTLDKGRRPESFLTESRYADYGSGQIQTWIIEPQLNYNKDLGSGAIELLVGSTFQETKRDRFSISGTGFNSDIVMENIGAASSIRTTTVLKTLYRYNALYGRVNYNYKQKYLLNVTTRRDGSSRFGSKNLFNNFWSVGAGWIFTDEIFLANILPFLNFGKIRASYGTTGSDQIGDYQFLDRYSSYPVNVPYLGSPALLPESIPNPYLQWEETKKFQIGVDLNFLNDKMIWSATYIRNRSSNQLLSYILPSIAGFSNIPSVNFPATLQNSSLEISLSTKNLSDKSLKWNTEINLTLPENKLMKFPGIEKSAYYSAYVVGEPFTIDKIYDFQGVNSTTGLFEFRNQNGNLTSNPDFETDRTVIINRSPTLFGGIQNNLVYKNFELNILFQFVKQKGANYLLGNYPGVPNNNQPISVLDRWMKIGDENGLQKISTGSDYDISNSYSAATLSKLSWEDASFIRMKNVALYWTLPQSFSRKAGTDMLKLFFSGQNLLTFTKYSGLDPETLSSISLPPLAIFTIGLQAKF